MLYKGELINFVKKYKRIACYGAANYGHTVKNFLKKYKVNVDYFIVTQKEEMADYIDGVKLVDVSNLPEDILSCCIVISTTEKYHESIKGKLLTIGISKNNIFSITNKIWIDLYSELLNDRRNYNLLEIAYKCVYEQRAKKLKGKYDAICVDYIDVGALGAYAGWIGCQYKAADNVHYGKFFLYYPYTAFEQEQGGNLQNANMALLSRFTGKDVEIVSPKNIDFWRYYLQNYTTNVVYCNQIKPHEISCNPDYINRYKKHIPHEKYVHISKNDIANGKYYREKMGVRLPYICISARDSDYLAKKKNMKKIPIIDEFRNSDIEGLRETADYLKMQNIICVRMGVTTEKKFIHDNVIDYANMCRSEFMDVYLTFECKFFVSGLNGITALPNLFNKPMVIMNAALLTTRGDSGVWASPYRDIGILKKMWDTRNKRYLTIKQMLEFEVESECIEKSIRSTFLLYQKKGIIPVDNSPEEILAVVQEMNERIDGNIQYDELDLELQGRYREIVDNYPMRDNVLNNWRLGAKFLRENQWLLDG